MPALNRSFEARETLKAPVCILGGGPAAVIAADRLHKRGCRTLLVSEEMMGLIAPMTIEERAVNPVPIFPVRGSTLSRWYDLDEHPAGLTVTYHNEGSSPRLDVTPRSFADQVSDQIKARSVLLGVKQFGGVVLTNPLRQLRRKVARHYAHAHPREERIGYRDGCSPYWWLLRGMHPQFVVSETPIAIDVEHKLVITPKTVIEFETLISTLPMPQFLDLAGQAGALTFLSSGLTVMIFGGDGGFPENTLLYDADPCSPVYRVFVPSAHVVAAQLANDGVGAQPHEVAIAVAHLLGKGHPPPRFVRRLHVKMAYPLDAEPVAPFDNLVGEFRSRGIHLHGRLAQWEYLDLHELDWDAIDDIAQYYC